MTELDPNKLLTMKIKKPYGVLVSFKSLDHALLVYYRTNEPRHVISNNVVFCQVLQQLRRALADEPWQPPFKIRNSK